MNKMLTAAAVSAVTAWAVGYSAIASAEADFYGRVQAGALYSDNDKANDDGAWNLGAVGRDGNNAFASSRFGFKGESDLGNGLTAGFKIEREIDGGDDTSQRHNLVYISGGFGTITLGNQGNPYMNARNWDQTNLFGGEWHESYRLEGINYGMSSGAFSLNVMALANDTNIDDGAETGYTCDDCGGNTITSGAEVSGDDGIDGWIFHAGYNFGPVALNVAHHIDNKDVDINSASSGTDAEAVALAQAVGSAVADLFASRDRTAIGVNGSAGPLDWNLAYQTTELNASGDYDGNDINSIGGFLGFKMNEKDIIYGYHVAHSADRVAASLEGLTDDDGNFLEGDALAALSVGDVLLGEDYSETIVGYSRQIGPGLKFIAEYSELNRDLDITNGGDETSKLGLAVKMDF